jgi:hypothetical protein
MKARNYLGSYLQKEDVPGEITVTIARATEESLDENERPKLILYFKEVEKGLVCNVTNINVLIDIFGDDDTDRWIHGQVILYTDPSVMFAGKRVGGLRVRPFGQTAQGRQTRTRELDLNEETGELVDRNKRFEEETREARERREEAERERQAIADDRIPDAQDPAQGKAFPGSDIPDTDALRAQYAQYISLCEVENVNVKGRGFVEKPSTLDPEELKMRIGLMRKWLTPPA